MEGRLLFSLHNFKTPCIVFYCNHLKSSLNVSEYFVFKSGMLHKMKIYLHGLSPLLMDYPYSKFVLAIKRYPLTVFQIFCRSYCDKSRSRF